MAFQITGNTVLFIIAIIWTLIWKGIALWKSGRQTQKAWFIVMLILNTLGIIPIVYLIWFQKTGSLLKKTAVRRIRAIKRAAPKRKAAKKKKRTIKKKAKKKKR